MSRDVHRDVEWMFEPCVELREFTRMDMCPRYHKHTVSDVVSDDRGRRNTMNMFHDIVTLKLYF